MTNDKWLVFADGLCKLSINEMNGLCLDIIVLFFFFKFVDIWLVVLLYIARNVVYR